MSKPLATGSLWPNLNEQRVGGSTMFYETKAAYTRHIVLAISAFILLSLSSAQAEIYRCVSATGSVSYGSRPCADERQTQEVAVDAMEVIPFADPLPASGVTIDNSRPYPKLSERENKQLFKSALFLLGLEDGIEAATEECHSHYPGLTLDAKRVTWRDRQQPALGRARTIEDRFDSWYGTISAGESYRREAERSRTRTEARVRRQFQSHNHVTRSRRCRFLAQALVSDRLDLSTLNAEAHRWLSRYRLD